MGRDLGFLEEGAWSEEGEISSVDTGSRLIHALTSVYRNRLDVKLNVSVH